MQDQSAEHLSFNRQTLTAILQALTEPALTRLEADDLSHAVLRCLREMMVADNLALLLLTEDHAALRIHTVLGVEETVAHAVYIPVGQGFAGQIIAQGVPLIVHDTSKLEILTPVLREEFHSLLGVPLIVHQQVIGVLHIVMKCEYLFADSDVALLVEVADALAQAFERTVLIEAEQHEFEELIEAQLCAIVELVQIEQRMAKEGVEAQLHAAGELVETQQQMARDLVGTQQQMARDLVDAQQQAARDLVKAQNQVTADLMKVQHQGTEDLVEIQQQTTRESVQIQQRIARDLVDAQQQATGELVEVQRQTAGDLMGAQQQTSGDLVDAQHQVARDLVDAQHQVRLNVLERINELETVFNAIMDGIVVYDEHEHILCSNQAAQHLLGIEMHPAELDNHSSLS